jgi:hypothetical protein
MAADCRIVNTDDDGNVISTDPNPVEKIIKFEETNVGASFWGYYKGSEFCSSKTLNDIITEFDQSMVTANDDVNVISEKLTDYFEKNFPKFNERIGIHLAGYCKNNGDLIPIFRHFFHEKWNKPGEFVNEKCNEQCYLDGKLIPYSYKPFHAVFNGDNTIANLFFDFLPTIYPKRKRQIVLEYLNLDECIELARLTILTSGNILNLLTEMDKKITQKEVKDLMLAKITKNNGFEFI